MPVYPVKAAADFLQQESISFPRRPRPPAFFLCFQISSSQLPAAAVKLQWFRRFGLLFHFFPQMKVPAMPAPLLFWLQRLALLIYFNRGHRRHPPSYRKPLLQSQPSLCWLYIKIIKKFFDSTILCSWAGYLIEGSWRSFIPKGRLSPFLSKNWEQVLPYWGDVEKVGYRMSVVE